MSEKMQLIAVVVTLLIIVALVVTFFAQSIIAGAVTFALSLVGLALLAVSDAKKVRTA
jgi:hypothetical protein